MDIVRQLSFLTPKLFKKIKCNRATDKKQNIKNKFQESLFNRLSLLLLFLFILFKKNRLHRLHYIKIV
nr:MAG TPA: hypothetical protein [Caudoviricetes sp.]